MGKRAIGREPSKDIGAAPLRPANRTMLYGMTLKGRGTPDVESLRSYIEGLAYEHSFKPRVLLETLLAEFPLDGIKVDYPSLLKQWFIHGSTQVGAQILQRLEKATLADLGDSTLHRFGHIFPGVHLARSGGAMHCPVCVLENDGLAHGRLLWEVQCVTACPVHEVDLVDSRICGGGPKDRLTIAQRPALRSVCSSCGSLGYKCHNALPVPASNERIWVSRQVGALLALSRDETDSISADSLRRGLAELVAGCYEGSVVRAAQGSGLPKSSVSSWVRGIGRPSLASLTQLCLHARADLVHLVRGNYLAVSTDTAKLSSSRMLRRGYDRMNYSDDAVRDGLVAAAKRSVPPTLAAISLELGINIRAARYKFPAESKSLVEARVAHLQKERKLRFVQEVEIYAASASALQSRGIAVCSKYLQREANLYAFSGNVTRLEALSMVLIANGGTGVRTRRPAAPRPLLTIGDDRK